MIYKVKTNSDGLLEPNKRFVNTRNFNNPEFAASYKKAVKRKTRIHYLNKIQKINKAINTFYENAAKLMVEREGGVVLEGIGYFAFYMPMYRRFTEIVNTPTHIVRGFYETEYHNYLPYLFTDVFKTNKLKGWSMEAGFNQGLKNMYVHNRHPRKLYYKEVKLIYKNTAQ